MEKTIEEFEVKPSCQNLLHKDFSGSAARVAAIQIHVQPKKLLPIQSTKRMVIYNINTCCRDNQVQ